MRYAFIMKAGLLRGGETRKQFRYKVISSYDANFCIFCKIIYIC